MLDLRRVGFIGSAGLVLLVRTRQRCRRRGIPLTRRPGNAVRALLRARALTDFFEVCPDADAAGPGAAVASVGDQSVSPSG